MSNTYAVYHIENDQSHYSLLEKGTLSRTMLLGGTIPFGTLYEIWHRISLTYRRSWGKTFLTDEMLNEMINKIVIHLGDTYYTTDPEFSPLCGKGWVETGNPVTNKLPVGRYEVTLTNRMLNTGIVTTAVFITVSSQSIEIHVEDKGGNRIGKFRALVWNTDTLDSDGMAQVIECATLSENEEEDETDEHS